MRCLNKLLGCAVILGAFLVTSVVLDTGQLAAPPPDLPTVVADLAYNELPMIETGSPVSLTFLDEGSRLILANKCAFDITGVGVYAIPKSNNLTVNGSSGVDVAVLGDGLVYAIPKTS
jgi:hypothetical protein